VSQFDLERKFGRVDCVTEWLDTGT
jgi:hypothetical protein